MRYIFSAFNLFFLLSLPIVASGTDNATQLEEEELLLFLVKATTKTAQKTTKTVPKSTKQPTTTVNVTVKTSTTEEPVYDYQDTIDLKPVKGLRNCKAAYPSKCASLCKTLQVVYDSHNASPINTTSWILIAIFVILGLTTAVLFVKWREMRKVKFRQEINLSNLEKIRANNEKVAVEHARQDNIDASPAKFPNKGNITIATNLDEAFKQRNEDENEVNLENVEYDEHGNELFDIGDDLDKFEGNTSDKSKSGSKMVKSKSKVT